MFNLNLCNAIIRLVNVMVSGCGFIVPSDMMNVLLFNNEDML